VITPTLSGVLGRGNRLTLGLGPRKSDPLVSGAAEMSRNTRIRLSELSMGSEDKSASRLRSSSLRRIMPVHMDQATSASRPKRKASIEDLEELGRRATVVIEEARRISLQPENKKTLRTFTMSEVCQLLDLHPTAYYELIRTNPEFEGSKVDRKRLFSLAEIHQIQGHLNRLPRQRFGIERAITISVANFKGGVAKTFTAVTLAQYLAMRGYRTLVIDTDPQASLTSSFGLNSSDVSDWNTILPYLYGQAEVERMGETWPASFKSTIQPTYWSGLDIVAANLTLYTGEFILGLRREIAKNSDQPFEFHRPLLDAIEDVRSDYDVIIIDNPPALSLSTTGAIFAADGLILPTPAETLDFESARAFMTLAAEILKAVRTSFGTNKELEIFRILITRFSERKAEKKIANRILEVFGDWAIQEPMVSSSSVQKIGSEWKTLYEEDPRGKGRSVLKRALDAANLVNGLIEADIIDVFREWQEKRMAATRAAA
jgi:chromosome partitioning protein